MTNRKPFPAGQAGNGATSPAVSASGTPHADGRSPLSVVIRPFPAAIGTEVMKLRRSKITWLSFLVYLFMISVAGFFMWIMKNPGTAERLGIMGQKAQLALGGESIVWATFLGFVLEMCGIGGMVLLSIIMSYVFGREYAEGTAKNMLTEPVPRTVFVAAKLVVSAAWFLLLTIWAIALTAAAGFIVGLGEFDPALFRWTAGRIALAAVMAFILANGAAWVAVQTRGYLAPLGYTIFTMLLSVIFGATGWGEGCPWSILMWFTGASGPDKNIGWGSWVVLAGFLILSLGLTIRHESFADNTQ